MKRTRSHISSKEKIANSSDNKPRVRINQAVVGAWLRTVGQRQSLNSWDDKGGWYDNDKGWGNYNDSGWHDTQET